MRDGRSMLAPAALVLAVMAVTAHSVAAQSVMVGAQVATVDVGEFDARDNGVGVLVGARLLGPVWGEAALLRYPGDLGDARFSQNRVEGMFGVSAGPSLAGLRPFVKGGLGFVRYAGSGGPYACILIYPPPLACQLAAGQTLPAYELGAGVSITPFPMTFFRLDVSRRFVRYPGPTFSGSGVHDDDFWDGDLRLGLSAGMRF